MEINHFSSTTVINDAYNASFESMKSAIETLEQSDCQGKKVAILGEMLELGEQSKKIHLQLGKAIANMHIDQLICIGGDTQYIHQGAQDHGFEKTVFFQTKQAFAEMSDQYIHQGDLILLKGSRSTQMEDLLELFN
jgi:UDP-N-acetylmuramoyl-tripeptide--D-alanyl-D-alanine ligase